MANYIKSAFSSYLPKAKEAALNAARGAAGRIDEETTPLLAQAVGAAQNIKGAFGIRGKAAYYLSYISPSSWLQYGYDKLTDYVVIPAINYLGSQFAAVPSLNRPSAFVQRQLSCPSLQGKCRWLERKTAHMANRRALPYPVIHYCDKVLIQACRAIHIPAGLAANALAIPLVFRETLDYLEPAFSNKVLKPITLQVAIAVERFILPQDSPPPPQEQLALPPPQEQPAEIAPEEEAESPPEPQPPTGWGWGFVQGIRNGAAAVAGGIAGGVRTAANGAAAFGNGAAYYGRKGAENAVYYGRIVVAELATQGVQRFGEAAAGALKTQFDKKKEVVKQKIDQKENEVRVKAVAWLTQFVYREGMRRVVTPALVNVALSGGTMLMQAYMGFSMKEGDSSDYVENAHLISKYVSWANYALWGWTALMAVRTLNQSYVDHFNPDPNEFLLGACQDLAALGNVEKFQGTVQKMLGKLKLPENIRVPRIESFPIQEYLTGFTQDVVDFATGRLRHYEVLKPAPFGFRFRRGAEYSLPRPNLLALPAPEMPVEYRVDQMLPQVDLAKLAQSIGPLLASQNLRASFVLVAQNDSPNLVLWGVQSAHSRPPLAFERLEASRPLLLDAEREPNHGLLIERVESSDSEEEEIIPPLAEPSSASASTSPIRTASGDVEQDVPPARSLSASEEVVERSPIPPVDVENPAPPSVANKREVRKVVDAQRVNQPHKPDLVKRAAIVTAVASLAIVAFAALCQFTTINISWMASHQMTWIAGGAGLALFMASFSTAVWRGMTRRASR